MGSAAITPGDPQAYAEGSVGWVADRPVLHVLGQEIPIRWTVIFHREAGEWKIIQEHMSVGAPNVEVVGKEFTTELPAE
jgi:hypothetical protein